VPPPVDLNALEARVWPSAVRRGDDGAIRVADVSVRDLAVEHGTPAYLIDEADWRTRARTWLAAFGEFDPAEPPVHYAGKAFLCKAVARWAAEEGLGLDVCTGGEIGIALAADFPAHRLTFHGNNKSDGELVRALEAGVGRIVLDSFDEIERLARLAAQRGVRPRVMVRVTVGVEAHTHEFIATAHEDQKFGFSLSGGSAAEAVRRVLKHDSLDLVGIHSHIGSQIFDTSGFEVAAHRAVGLLASVRDEHGVRLPELDLGGGFGIAYVGGDDPADAFDIVAGLKAIVGRECFGYGLPVPRLTVEPGRAISGTPGVTLYEVGTVKALDGLRTYVSVDGGMSDNIRTALYDAAYTCVLASRVSEEPPMLVRVVGKHCESGDIVVRDAWLPADVAPGDLLMVAATGAYCRSMASNYNQVLRPPVVSVLDGESRVIVRRETEADLLTLDVG
jgi:diaminopimelate decarboxylase